MGEGQRIGDVTTQQPAPRVRAFLIADLRGYTRFSERHGDEAAARLTARFATLAADVVSRHTGSVVETRGDEILVVFDSPRDAVRAAIELQAALAAASSDDLQAPLAAGVGIDAGEVAVTEHGFRGRALNMAARLCARARPGEILVTPELAHLVGASEGVAFEDRGPVHMKGISRPIRLHAITQVSSGTGAAIPAGTLEFRAALSAGKYRLAEADCGEQGIRLALEQPPTW